MQKMISKNIFSSLCIMQFLEKLWEMRKHGHRYQACNTLNKKELFNVGSELSYSKHFF